MNNSFIKRIQSARTTLLLEQPFFGVLALQLEIIEDNTQPTAYTDGRVLAFNPEWVNSLDNSKLKGAIAHEVMHCAMGHPWRRQGREMLRWNAACDFAINGVLKGAGFDLPIGVLYDEAFEGKTSEWIYDRLPETQCMGCCKGMRDAQGSEGEEQTSGTEADWKRFTQQAYNVAKMQGKLPDNVKRFIGDILSPKVDWRSLLRKYVQEIVRSDYSWTRPNFRYIAHGLYMPALRSMECGRIAVGVDTSGSIDNILLNQFAGEVRAIASEVQPSSVDVLYCDAKVNRHDVFYRGDHVELFPCGGGGTDFRPVFKALRKEPPVVLIYLTDLMGTFPKKAPDYPVVWASICNTPVPFGDLVWIQ